MPPYESYRGELPEPREDAFTWNILLVANAERLGAWGAGCDGEASSGSAVASAISGITDVEVGYGLARNPGPSPRVRETMRVLLVTISVLPFGRKDARVAGQLRASLNNQGTPIGAYDLLLVACPLRSGLKILTLDARGFVRVGGLGLEDWCSR
jgi:tRNA(fMet)-specific endonuclease VapC